MKIKKSNIKKITYVISTVLVLAIIFFAVSSSQSQKQKALIQTNYGSITIQLNPSKAPITVANFENYVNQNFYDGTVFHRVIKGFMIQGGGFTTSGTQKQTNSPIKLESNNGLSNKKYSIAMARTNDPNSATSQFFINTADNKFLDYGVRDQGYAVFGKVINGFDTVDKIENVQTTTKGQLQNWPIENVIIKKVILI